MSESASRYYYDDKAEYMTIAEEIAEWLEIQTTVWSRPRISRVVTIWNIWIVNASQ